jgi:predicted nucleic acid-binding protein
MTFVIDASVAIKWLVPETLAENAARLLDANYRLTAPDLLLVEFAKIIWKKARLGEIRFEDGEAALLRLSAGPIELAETRPLLRLALQLAHELHHPVYDCVYLATAEASGAVAVTADRRFYDRTRNTPHADGLQWLGFVAAGPEE